MAEAGQRDRLRFADADQTEGNQKQRNGEQAGAGTMYQHIPRACAERGASGVVATGGGSAGVCCGETGGASFSASIMTSGFNCK